MCCTLCTIWTGHMLTLWGSWGCNDVWVMGPFISTLYPLSCYDNYIASLSSSVAVFLYCLHVLHWLFIGLATVCHVSRLLFLETVHVLQCHYSPATEVHAYKYSTSAAVLCSLWKTEKYSVSNRSWYKACSAVIVSVHQVWMVLNRSHVTWVPPSTPCVHVYNMRTATHVCLPSCVYSRSGSKHTAVENGSCQMIRHNITLYYYACFISKCIEGVNTGVFL